MSDVDRLTVIARAVEKMVAEANRILDAPELESEREDNESPEAFVMRKALLASGLPDQLEGAVEAERHRNAALVRALAGNSWDPSVEAALYEVARQITASGGQ